VRSAEPSTHSKSLTGAAAKVARTAPTVAATAPFQAGTTTDVDKMLRPCEPRANLDRVVVGAEV